MEDRRLPTEFSASCRETDTILKRNLKCAQYLLPKVYLLIRGAVDFGAAGGGGWKFSGEEGRGGITLKYKYRRIS